MADVNLNNAGRRKEGRKEGGRAWSRSECGVGVGVGVGVMGVRASTQGAEWTNIAPPSLRSEWKLEGNLFQTLCSAFPVGRVGFGRLVVSRWRGDWVRVCLETRVERRNSGGLASDSHDAGRSKVGGKQNLGYPVRKSENQTIGKIRIRKSGIEKRTTGDGQ